jgi:hypothetical protein
MAEVDALLERLAEEREHAEPEHDPFDADGGAADAEGR